MEYFAFQLLVKILSIKNLIKYKYKNKKIKGNLEKLKIN